MIKRILSLMLIFVLVSGVVNIAEAKTQVSEDIAHKCDVLMGLKVINPRDFVYAEAIDRTAIGASSEPIKNNLFNVNDYDLFRDISKRSFINYICNIYGDYGFTEQYSEEAIKIAEAEGIIHEGQDDLYKPLNYEEAITMIIRMLGYGNHAEEGGGFPYGYISIANKLGITDGVSAKPGDRLQGNDAVELLYNAINCPYVEIHSITDEGIVYGNTSDYTALYEYRKIYKAEGILNGTEFASLRTEIELDKGKIMIDGYIYSTSVDYSDKLGLFVEAYILEKDGDDEVLFVSSYRNKEMILSSDEIAGVSEDCGTITYFDSNYKEKKVSLSSKVSVIYNGQPIKSYTSDILHPADGTVRMVDNGENNAYDVVFITDYKTVVVDGVSYMNKTVKNMYTYNPNNQSLNLYEDDNDSVKIIGTDGNEIQIADLEKGDVLKVAESTLGDKRVVNAYLSNRKVSGTVLNVSRGDKTILTVDGEKHVLSVAYEKALAGKDEKAYKIEVGKSYTFSLDNEGYIAFAEDTEGLMKYAIVYAKASSGVFGTNCSVQLFTIDGEWKELKLADKVELDEEGRLDAENVLNRIAVSRNGEVSVIGYITNSDGKIKAIDTPEIYNNGNNGRFNMKDKETLLYRTGNVSFDSQTYIKDNAKFWFVDASGMDEKNSYQVAPRNFSSNESYNFYAFNIDEFNFADIFVIMEEESDASRNIQLAPAMIVDSVGDSMTAEGETLKNITGAAGEYASVTYYCEDDVVFTEYSTGRTISVNELKQGDIISVSMNSDGRIIRGKRYRTASDGVVYENPGTLHIIESIVQGVAGKVDGTGMRIKVNCGEKGIRDMRIPEACPVYIYDIEREQIRRGSLNDIEENDIIFIKNGWNYARGIVVYQ